MAASRPSSPSSGATARESSRVKDTRRLFECADGASPGASDTGVTKTEIRLGATFAGSGPLADSDVRYAMEAMKNRINAAGGICGRALAITYYDDGLDEARGSTMICRMADEVFALAVVPSYEGLAEAIKSGCIDRARIPVVGTLGITSGEYNNPWVWPIAASGPAFARAVIEDAWRAGARTFGIVFDRNPDLEFVQVARAYNAEVRRRTGHDIAGYNEQNRCQRSYCGVMAGQSSYATEVQQFEPADVTVLAMMPATALTWMASPGVQRDRRYDLTPSLFGRGFANNCQSACDGMRVWAPFESPVGENPSEAVRRYVQDLKKTKQDADEYNLSAEGAYAGVMMLADAMARAGTDLTRAGLRHVLDSQTFATGLMPSFRYTAAPTRESGRCLRSYQIRYKGTFSGWRQVSGWVCS